MKGVVTADDIVAVVEKRRQKTSRTRRLEALDAPYLKIAFGRMVRNGRMAVGAVPR